MIPGGAARTCPAASLLMYTGNPPAMQQAWKWSCAPISLPLREAPFSLAFQIVFKSVVGAGASPANSYTFLQGHPLFPEAHKFCEYVEA